jgi:hypothetical protein
MRNVAVHAQTVSMICFRARPEALKCRFLALHGPGRPLIIVAVHLGIADAQQTTRAEDMLVILHSGNSSYVEELYRALGT